MRGADQIRSAFLRYFEERGHRIVPSSSLVPAHDPTLLFANAGMNQFKDVFLGRDRRDYARAASSQKCVRAGGKHNDLENVGRTARHHTFFEMLGNFSFGDYFKREAIGFGWEFLTRELGLPADRLKVTIFSGAEGIPRDAEACSFWREHVSGERILELGAKDNFWAMGETGPCGPCSEIHFFQGDDLPCPQAAGGGQCAGVECECDRWLEVWNLVFMQFDRDASGRLEPLPAPCVDTGMGLERVCAVVQGRRSNYETDLFTPLIAAVERRTGRRYGAGASDDVSMRVIADHLRATSFIVGDGAVPGNEGRGYVLRKIMRRAMRHGRRLGVEEPFLAGLTADVVDRMSGAYPELLSEAETIRRVVQLEEERFADTLKVALGEFEKAVRAARAGAAAGPALGGEAAFRLYDTYGLPLDLIEDLAGERGLAVDAAGFEREMESQRERARQASKMGAVTGEPVFLELLEQGRTQFLGYEALSAEDARVLAVLRDGRLARRLVEGEEGQVVLDRTPFYGESGGQLGDRGVLHSDGSAAEVVDCTLPVPGLYAHRVKVTAGGFERGMTVRAQVDPHFRAGTMRHHTGTHLLHAALREVLGPHVKQAGSLVAPDRLRFDFSHYAPLTPREARHIENRVNAEIVKSTPLLTRVMGRDEALAYGALAFFGDKYGERVRVIEVPGFSKEFCGGTHVGSTGEIGLFLFKGEQGVSAGTRRVEALTGAAALARAQQDQGILDELETTAKTDRRSLVEEYARLREQLKAKEREVQALKLKLATGASGSGQEEVSEVSGIKLWTPRFEGLDRKAHAAVVDDFRNRHQGDRFALLSASVEGDSVHVIGAVSESLESRLPAPELLRRLELRGGGRPGFAQGGGVSALELDALRRRVAQVVREMLEKVGV